ncbi:MAG: radical SAM family heme chaperone HemW [Endomicrobiia bacterium]
MLGVYIHIPFCKKKCNYCDFCSYVRDENTISLYLDALKREIFYYTSFFSFLIAHSSSFFTIYIGGGTPSLLNCHQLKFLFDSIIDNFDISKVCEITFECNPESITKEKLKILKDFGVNRLSIGVQSLNDKILKFLGRVHTKNDFLKKYELARRLGFENINIDLIYGIPGQTLNNWEETLKNVVRLKPEHISAYCLTIEEGTKLKKDGIVLDDDKSADMYEFAVSYLVNYRYKHYEISNFAFPKYECKHNINYWQNGQYFGFGCSAVSYLNGIRRKNTTDLDLYIETAGEKTAVEEIDIYNPEKYLSEKIFLGLRMTEGIPLTQEIKNKYGQVIDRFINEGFLKLDSGNISLTKSGLFVSNRIFMEFV